MPPETLEQQKEPLKQVSVAFETQILASKQSLRLGKLYFIQPFCNVPAFNVCGQCLIFASLPEVTFTTPALGAHCAPATTAEFDDLTALRQHTYV